MTVLSKADSWQMFNGIAGTYDRVNTVLSAGIDRSWRRLVRRRLPKGSVTVLDVATGTGELAFELLRAPNVASVVGVDKAAEMLAVADQKANGDSRVTFQEMDAQALDLEDNTFDVVTISFGIRNVPDPVQGLREMARVLRPGGQVMVLEFSLPTNSIVRMGYLAYFRHVLPLVGGAISGDTQAYRYLNQTVEAFPEGEGFAALLGEAGFHDVSWKPLTLGIATLYQGSA